MRLLKLTLFFIVLLTSSLRPMVVYAHNSKANHLRTHSVSKYVLTRHHSTLKTLHVLDKEKNDSFYLADDNRKEIMEVKPRHDLFVLVAVPQAVPVRSQILRI